MFQSTPLREGRLKKLPELIQYTRFNPRPCVRGDRFGLIDLEAMQSFNPRPCVRGDRVVVLRKARCLLFQSTPLREGRRFGWCYWVKEVPVSIHAPA